MSDKKRIKLNSFTLIEILIASFIFVSVITIAATAFAMVRKTNSKVDDQRIASSCARALEDFITAQVQASNLGEKILVLKDASAGGPAKKYTLLKPDQTLSNTALSGIVLFQSERGSNVVKIILKDTRDGKWNYIYRKMGESEFVFARGGTYSLAQLLPDPSPIQSDECRAIVEGDFARPTPFQVKVVEKYQTLPASAARAEPNYHVILNDVLFRNFGSDLTSSSNYALEKKTVSRAYVYVLNNAESI